VDASSSATASTATDFLATNLCAHDKEWLTIPREIIINMIS
jgi:hypothetical protein